MTGVLFAAALLALLAGPSEAEQVAVPDCCGFTCPDGWEVRQESPKEDLTRTTCRPPCLGPGCGARPVLSVDANMRRGKHGFETHFNAIRSGGEQVRREAVFNGLRALYTTRADESAVYVPVRRGFIRLGYRAPTELFEAEAERFLDLQRSFSFQTLCAAGSAQGKAARVTPEAAVWQPVSVRSDSRPVPVSTFVKTKRHGESRALAKAAVYDVAYDCLLVVSVFPESLASEGGHFEFRYGMAGSRLDSAEVKLVRIEDPSKRSLKQDSRWLRRRGIAFSEDSSGGGKLTLYRLEPWADAATDNRAVLGGASFSGLGSVSVGYDVTGAAEGVE
ncbi:MAG: hypothetical protein HY924_04175 [Elusimicrobia bacterium]|nr:hypothetical protein [Elusimicrobiota bacterium]